MSQIARIIGQRIRNFRTEKDLSQERLAEMAGFHPTYIGQLERGEKNATLETIESIAIALDIPLSRLFEALGNSASNSIPLQCYEFVASKSLAEQQQLYRLLLEIDQYKHP